MSNIDIYTTYNSCSNTSSDCFYGFVEIMTENGLKQMKDIKRGDKVLTNEGYQSVTQIQVSVNPVKEPNKLMVKIPKNFFKENVPSSDIYVTDTHPLSVEILTPESDKDYEFLHLFTKDLVSLGLKYEDLKKEKHLYNLIFDKHYEISVGNMKFLSHHPNHFNGNVVLRSGNEINKANRSKKIYALRRFTYFKQTTLNDLLKNKPENISKKEFIGDILKFN